jgi:hypothetical protein
MHVRLATPSTGELYVTEKQWLRATLKACPWHPHGGCGFCRHGTYPRVRPSGTKIARWYCPTAGRTVSALPDALASHRSGTLANLEAHVIAVEQAQSLLSVAMQRRLEIELPGALRYLSRLSNAIHKVLRIAQGLLPPLLASLPPTITGLTPLFGEQRVLVRLREKLARFLPQLPAPLGFNPSRNKPVAHFNPHQQQMGRDPPCAFVDPANQPIADRQPQERPS